MKATPEGGFILGARSVPGNPYDGHTLPEALEQVEILTGRRPSLAVGDRGYPGHGVQTTRVLISGTRRGITRKRPLTAGDAIFAVLCACGHNLRKILAHLRALLALLLAAILTAIGRPEPRHNAPDAA